MEALIKNDEAHVGLLAWRGEDNCCWSTDLNISIYALHLN